MQPQLQAPTLSLGKGQSPAEAPALPEASAGNGLGPAEPHHERAPLLFGGGGADLGRRNALPSQPASQSGPVRRQRIIHHSGPFPPLSQHNNQKRRRERGERGERDVRADIQTLARCSHGNSRFSQFVLSSWLTVRPQIPGEAPVLCVVAQR